MIIVFLRNLRGYLDVRFTGVYSEKILSALAKEKIPVWKLKYFDGNIDARIYASDYKKLRKIRKKTGVKIKIIKKHGFPFFIKRYTYRSGFLLGAVIFFAVLKFLSTFVWVINVEGNQNVKSADIIKTLSNIGISENTKISDIDAKQSAQNLLLRREDLAWASLNIEGCVLNVNVSEIEQKPDDRAHLPSNLVAKKDGIIKKIDAVSGDVIVKVGENVHKGDVLVSGILESMSSTAFVKSNAIVVAQVEMNYTKKEMFSKSVKYKTGKNSYENIMEILGVKFPLFLPQKRDDVYINYNFNQVRLLGKKVPIFLYRRQYDYYKKVNVTLSEEELKNKLSKELDDFLEKKDIEGYIPIGTEYYSDSDGVTISHRYLCDENIVKEGKILLG